ncbi:MAG: 30S ribosomal protein S6 [Nitrospira sp.]|nr:30S ribosomal protein S6 [Candidatus Manganitrophaceae bacterium]HIL35669.1 30S ribosomal protein S6 [Candidatus Manganitrophaceae bacterium]
MNAYETIYIVKPTLSEEEITKITDKIKALIEKDGGEIVGADSFGKKRLAYEVRKEKRGIYLILHFRATPAILLELEQSYRLSETIIKYLTIKISEDQLGKMIPVRDEKSFSPRARGGRY